MQLCKSFQFYTSRCSFDFSNCCLLYMRVRNERNALTQNCFHKLRTSYFMRSISGKIATLVIEKYVYHAEAYRWNSCSRGFLQECKNFYSFQERLNRRHWYNCLRYCRYFSFFHLRRLTVCYPYASSVFFFVLTYLLHPAKVFPTTISSWPHLHQVQTCTLWLLTIK